MNSRPKRVRRCADLAAELRALARKRATMPHPELAEMILEESGYTDM